MKADNRNITHDLLDSSKLAHKSGRSGISNKSDKTSNDLSLFEYSASDIFRQIKNVVGLGSEKQGKSFENALKKSLSNNRSKIENLAPEKSITLSISLPSDDDFNTTFPSITIFKTHEGKFDLIYGKKVFASNLSSQELKSYCTTKESNSRGLKKIADQIKRFKFHEIKTKLAIFKGSTIKWIKKLSAKTKYHIASFVKYNSNDEKLQKKLADTLGYLSGLGYKFENQHPITDKKNGEVIHDTGKVKFSKENIKYVNGKIKLTSEEQLLRLCRKILASEEAFAILPSIIENIHNKDEVWDMLASLAEESPKSSGYTINKIKQFEIALTNIQPEKTDKIKNQCVQLKQIIKCVEKNAPKRDGSKITSYYNNIQGFLLGKYDISHLPSALQMQIKKEIDLESGIAGWLYLNRQMCEFIVGNIISYNNLVSIKVQPHPLQTAFSYISCSKIFNEFTNKINDNFQSFLEEVNPQEFYQTKSLEELHQEILEKQKNQTNKTPDFALFLHGSDTKDAEGHADIDSNDSSNLKPQTFTRLNEIIKRDGVVTSEIIDGPTMLGENFTSNIAQGLIRCLQYIKKNRDDAQAAAPETIKIMITGHSRGAVEAIQINNILNELIKNGFKSNLPILRDLSDHHEAINEQLKLIQNIDGINDVKFNLSVYAFDPVLGMDSSLTHRKGFDLPKIFNSANNVTNDYTIFVAEDEERGYFDLFLPKVVNMQSNKEITKITLVPLKSSHTDMVRYPKPNYKKQGGLSTTHNLLIDILNLDKKYYIVDQEQHEYRYKKPTLLRRILQFLGYKGKTRTKITTHFNNKKSK